MADAKHRIADSFDGTWIEKGFGDFETFRAEVLVITVREFVVYERHCRHHLLVVWSIGNLEAAGLEVTNYLLEKCIYVHLIERLALACFIGQHVYLDHVVVPRLGHFRKVCFASPLGLFIVFDSFL